MARNPEPPPLADFKAAYRVLAFLATPSVALHIDWTHLVEARRIVAEYIVNTEETKA